MDINAMENKFKDFNIKLSSKLTKRNIENNDYKINGSYNFTTTPKIDNKNIVTEEYVNTKISSIPSSFISQDDDKVFSLSNISLSSFGSG